MQDNYSKPLDSQSIQRTGLIEEEIYKLFLSFNRPLTQKTAQAKALLLCETLSSLKTEKIRDFFKDCRGMEALPSDGQMEKLLNQQYHKYGVKTAPLQYRLKKEDLQSYRDGLMLIVKKYPKYRPIAEKMWNLDPDEPSPPELKAEIEGMLKDATFFKKEAK